MKLIHEDQSKIVLKSRNLVGFIFPLPFVVVGIILLVNPTIIGAKEAEENLLFPIVFIAVGLFSMIAASFFTVSFDKGTQQIAITRTRIIGRRSQIYQFNQIKEVRHEQELKYVQRSRGRVRVTATPRVISRIILMPKDGPAVSFPGSYQNSEWLADKIAQFIGVPLVSTRPPTAGEALRTVRDTIKEAMEQKKQSQGKGGGGAPPPLVQ